MTKKVLLLPLSLLLSLSLSLSLFLSLLLTTPLLAITTIDSSARDINGIHGNTPIASQAGHVFICYIDGNLDVNIAHKLPNDTWESPVTIATGNADDAHNYCSLGIDTLGYVHASYDQHSSGLNYKRSVTPYDVQIMMTAAATMPVPANAEISYPQFVRAGRNLETLLFLYRNGASGNGDECLNRYDEITLQWVSVACPMIKGKDLANPSSPYLAPPRVDSLGNLRILYTNRVSYYNFGLFTLTYDASINAFLGQAGESLTLPLTLNSPGSVVLASSEKVSNSGLNIDALTASVVYLRETSGKYEVFAAKYNTCTNTWTHRQLTHERLELLDSCPNHARGLGLRPCNMQMLAPSLVRVDGGINAADNDDVLLVVYGTAVSESRGAWTRPLAELHTIVSRDGGVSWSQPEPLTSMPPRYCELSSDTLISANSSQLYTLAQNCNSESSTLEMWDASDFTSMLLTNNLTSKYKLEATNINTPIESGDNLTLSTPLIVEMELFPFASTQPMGVLDKSYTSGSREIRIVLWGEVIGGVFSYSPNSLQVAIGNSTGDWGLLWYPQVSVPSYQWTQLKLTYDGNLVKLYREDVLVAQTTYTGSIKDTTQKLVIGGVRSSNNDLVRPYSGHLTVEFR